MDAKLKDLWLKALRSGEYQQGEDYLSTRGRHCCLGVLCRVALENDLVPPGVAIELEHGHLYCNKEDDLIPGHAFGIDPEVVRGAWRRNDGKEGFDKHTFSQIADWLETAVSTDLPKE